MRLRQTLGDRYGEAVSHNAFGLLALRRRRLGKAEEQFGASQRIFAELGDRRWQAIAGHAAGVHGPRVRG